MLDGGEHERRQPDADHHDGEPAGPDESGAGLAVARLEEFVDREPERNHRGGRAHPGHQRAFVRQAGAIDRQPGRGVERLWYSCRCVRRALTCPFGTRTACRANTEGWHAKCSRRQEESVIMRACAGKSRVALEAGESAGSSNRPRHVAAPLPFAARDAWRGRVGPGLAVWSLLIVGGGLAHRVRGDPADGAEPPSVSPAALDPPRRAAAPRADPRGRCEASSCGSRCRRLGRSAVRERVRHPTSTPRCG